MWDTILEKKYESIFFFILERNRALPDFLGFPLIGRLYFGNFWISPLKDSLYKIPS